ncbi:hypothetical protein QVD17_25693 [Tagetes erecta]|uniref:GB1/RHD3-type G domain-containing protein n=1 Tax=Tagetes erecta TaxID=13708 RepID=A0AAD8KJZ5_TARER|nr:hypothetical protein QVD17_25693 [Tagetes erecta]
MDADMGRTQTTQGIWIARCVGIEPCTIVMDIEGTDGQERGEDHTVFEKQSALFAMTVSDIVILNMWCHDMGCEHASNKPLLKTVFQTPFEKLDNDLRKDIYKIWDTVSKPEAHKHSQLSEFFNVARLRQKFVQSVAPGGLASDRQGVVHACDFSLSTKMIWEEIKKIKDLKMPAYRIMVATVRCESIASQNYSSFAGNQVCQYI